MRGIQRNIGVLLAGSGIAVLIAATWAVENGSSDRVGAEASLLLNDKSLGEPKEENPISGMSDQLMGHFSESAGIEEEMPENVDIQCDGTCTVDKEANTMTFIGAPTVYMVADNHVEIFAHKAVVNTKEKTITLTGDLSIFRQGKRSEEGSLTRAEKAVYNYGTKELTTDNINLKGNGMILRGGTFTVAKNENGENYMEGFDTSVSSEDDQEPETWISAKRIRVYPKDRLNFSHLTFNYKNIPFFYFPYFSHSLNPREGYMPSFGARSYWGAFMLNRYGILAGNRRVDKGRPTADYLFQSHLDYRSRRGLAIGEDIVNLKTEEEAPNMKGLSLYYAYDQDPSISPTDEARKDINNNRWRIALQQMWKLSVDELPTARWRAKANINALSDQYVLRDFYQDLFEANSEPDNTLMLERTDRQSVLTMLQRLPVNDFYITDQRSEISYDRIRGALMNSRFIYESQTSIALMRQVVPAEMRMSIRDRLDHLPVSDPNRQFWEHMLQTDGFLRAHTYHELSRSYKAAGFLNITPRVGGGYTGYMDPTGDLGTFNQGIFYAGLDTSFKISRKYNAVHWDAMGLNTMNHIIQPYTTLMYIGANELDSPYPRIDGSASTTNPMALSVGRMTEIDALSTCSVLRYGVRNFLMTEQDNTAKQWLSWDAFMDAYIHNASSDKRFSNLYSMTRWSPLPWFSYASVVQFPVLGDDKRENYQEYNNSLWFQPFRSTEILCSHRYLTKHPLLEDSNQLNLRVIYRISEELALGGSWRWEMKRKDKRLEIQEYNIYKNMGSWYFGCGLFMRVNGGKNELGVGFSFTLKETGNYMPITFN